ncbi:MAG: AmmeMemoRadiSam system protein B, partial [Bacteroidota bacterium]
MYEKKLLSFLIFCHASFALHSQTVKLRGFADTVGFAHKKWQMDSVMKRIERQYGSYLDYAWKRSNLSGKDEWKMVICPHDDYTYASYMYPLVLKNVKAKTIIIFGVAH